MGDTIHGDQINIDRSPNSIGKQVNKSAPAPVNLGDLAAELGKLRREARDRIETTEDAVAFGAIAEAEQAAAAGDAAATSLSLRKAGEWALAVATAVGIPLAVEALRRALGMG